MKPKYALDQFKFWGFEPLSDDRKAITHSPDRVWLQVIDEIEARLKGNLKLLMFTIIEAIWY